MKLSLRLRCEPSAEVIDVENSFKGISWNLVSSFIDRLRIFRCRIILLTTMRPTMTDAASYPLPEVGDT